MSSKPIHGSERLPVREDGSVQFWHKGSSSWIHVHHDYIHDGNWWRVIDQTPPPSEPPKPKRLRWWFDVQSITDAGMLSANVLSSRPEGPEGLSVPVIQVLPTDPDWDELLDAIDNYRYDSRESWEKRILEARNKNVK